MRSKEEFEGMRVAKYGLYQLNDKYCFEQNGKSAERITIAKILQTKYETFILFTISSNYHF